MDDKNLIYNDKNQVVDAIDLNVIDWWHIAINNILSEKFIDYNQDKIGWMYVSIFQSLSEKFIEKHENNVDWRFIGQFQVLSEKFVTKHIDKLGLYNIHLYQKLSQEFLEENDLIIPCTCWIDKSKEYKLEKIRECKSYEIIDNEFIIAYKSVRDDYRSIYNY